MEWKVVFFALIFFAPLAAKVQVVKSVPSFFLKLSAAPYSVAVFYNKSVHVLKKNAPLKQQVDDLEALIKSLSQDPLYKNADLNFLLLDLSRPNLLSLTHKFAIKQLPSFIIFVGKQPVGQRLTGFIDRLAITEAINKDIAPLMQERMNQKEYQLKKDVENAKIRALNQAYMWGGYWAPYWNLGYAPFWEFGYRPYNWWYY